MRKDARLARHCLFLTLPVAAVVAFGLYFLLHGVPRIVAGERRWAEDAARRVARDLKARRLAPDFVWDYAKGVAEPAPDWARARFPASMTWKDWATRGKKKRADMWGWKELKGDGIWAKGLGGRAKGAGRRVVWVRDGRRVYGKATDIAETDYALWFWVFGLAGMASLVATAAFALRSLVVYAKSRDDFLAATAHDLTTPLVGMGYVIGRDDAEARTLNERMLRLVGNIKDFMRLGGRRTFKTEAFDLRRAYDKAYALFAADFRDLFDGADVAVEADGSAWVRADELATTQILWNLLGNELKYAAPFGRVTVRFSRDETTGRVAVEVADEGPGMTPRQMRRAFDRYYRARSVHTSGKGGFGIGLCVAREFAVAMGGALTVRATPSGGCCFTLTLPAEG